MCVYVCIHTYTHNQETTTSFAPILGLLSLTMERRVFLTVQQRNATPVKGAWPLVPFGTGRAGKCARHNYDIYIYIHIYIHLYMYIYIYRERERDACMYV